MDHRRLILAVYGVLFTGLIAWAGVAFLEARAELNQVKRSEADLRRRLADARARLAEQEKILQRLRNDPEYVEKVIREKMRYVKPGEEIFWFPD